MPKWYEKSFRKELALAQKQSRADYPRGFKETAVSPARKKLKRELRQEAILRMEESARTEEDFEKLVKEWNREDENRKRRERYHEILRSGKDLPLDYGESPNSTIFPSALGNFIVRQSRKGDFIEEIYCSPKDIHELVTPEYLISPLKDMKYSSKKLLFLRAIEHYSAAQIAEMRNQSDRNIRKCWNNILKMLQDQSEKGLLRAVENGYALSMREVAFLKNYRKETADK